MTFISERSTSPTFPLPSSQSMDGGSAVIPIAPHQRPTRGRGPLCGSLITGVKKTNQAGEVLTTCSGKIKVQRSLPILHALSECGMCAHAPRLPAKRCVNCWCRREALVKQAPSVSPLCHDQGLSSAIALFVSDPGSVCNRV